MWRKEPSEVTQARRICASVIGACIGIACFRVLGSVFPSPIRLLLSCVGMVALHLPFLNSTFNLVTQTQKALARRRARTLPPGPKFIVRARLYFDDKSIGEDIGVLRLHEGCLSFNGSRLDFSIPRDRLTAVDKPPTAIDADIDGELLRIAFEEIEKLEVEGDSLDLKYSLFNFWSRPSAGEFLPPPVTALPKTPLRRRWMEARIYVFWLAIAVLAVGHDIALEGREAKDARILFTCTYAVTVVVAAILPLLRYRKLIAQVKAASEDEKISSPARADEETQAAEDSVPRMTW